MKWSVTKNPVVVVFSYSFHSSVVDKRPPGPPWICPFSCRSLWKRGGFRRNLHLDEWPCCVYQARLSWIKTAPISSFSCSRVPFSSTVGAFSRFAGWNQSAQCENSGQATPAPLFGSFQDTQRKQKLHKMEECILFYAIFGRNLPLVDMLWYNQSGETPLPPTLLHGIGIPMEMVSAATRSTPLLW